MGWMETWLGSYTLYPSVMAEIKMNICCILIFSANFKTMITNYTAEINIESITLLYKVWYTNNKNFSMHVLLTTSFFSHTGTTVYYINVSGLLHRMCSLCLTSNFDNTFWHAWLVIYFQKERTNNFYRILCLWTQIAVNVVHWLWVIMLSSNQGIMS